MKATITILAALSAASIFTTGSLAASGPDDAARAEVDLVFSSSDTLADLTERIAAAHGDAVTASVLADLASAATEGRPTSIPSLDADNFGSVSKVLDQAQEAYQEGAPLPAAVAALPLAADLALENPNSETILSNSDFRVMTVEDPAPTDEGPDVIEGTQSSDVPAPTAPPYGSDYVPDQKETTASGPKYYTQNNFIKRSVRTSSGTFVVKDNVRMITTTNAGAASSRVDYNMTYFPTTGFFSSINHDTYSYTGKSTTWGDVASKNRANPGSWSLTVYNDPKANGKTLSHVHVLSGKTVQGTVSSKVNTPQASCNKSNNTCYYPKKNSENI